jgi:hypothetical protein
MTLERSEVGWSKVAADGAAAMCRLSWSDWVGGEGMGWESKKQTNLFRRKIWRRMIATA